MSLEVMVGNLPGCIIIGMVCVQQKNWWLLGPRMESLRTHHVRLIPVSSSVGRSGAVASEIFIWQALSMCLALFRVWQLLTHIILTIALWSKGVGLSPFSRWENGITEGLSNSLKDAQLVSGNAGIQTQAVYMWSLCFQLLCSSEVWSWLW